MVKQPKSLLIQYSYKASNIQWHLIFKNAQREMKPSTALLALSKGLWKLMFERLCILQPWLPACQTWLPLPNPPEKTPLTCTLSLVLQVFFTMLQHILQGLVVAGFEVKTEKEISLLQKIHQLSKLIQCIRFTQFWSLLNFNALGFVVPLLARMV